MTIFQERLFRHQGDHGERYHFPHALTHVQVILNNVVARLEPWRSNHAILKTFCVMYLQCCLYTHEPKLSVALPSYGLSLSFSLSLSLLARALSLHAGMFVIRHTFPAHACCLVAKASICDEFGAMFFPLIMSR